MYLKKDENNNITYPYSVQQLKLENKNISFPQNLTDEILENWGVYKVEKKLSGFEDDYTKDVLEVEPTLSGSVYVQTYEITDANEFTVNKRKEVKWNEIRDTRNNLLKESDWTQFADSPISGSKLTEWQTYRQSLRDITNQENPFEITWPELPI